MGKRLLIVVAGLVALTLGFAVFAMLRTDEAGGGPAFPTEEDRAIALGFLLDTPRSPEVTEHALVLGEKLRQRYGIDTGHPVSDREAAAQKAHAEILDRLTFEDQEIEETATALGYSLDPEQCANYCNNVRELAILELKRRALEAFADGKPSPFTPRE